MFPKKIHRNWHAFASFGGFYFGFVNSYSVCLFFVWITLVIGSVVLFRFVGDYMDGCVFTYVTQYLVPCVSEVIRIISVFSRASEIFFGTFKGL